MTKNRYNQQLLETKFFKLHPEYIPFIGNNYEEYKILHIGESHYLDQKSDSSADKYPITYFDKWWYDPCHELLRDFDGWYNTRDVITNYLNGSRHKGHSIFSETIKVFDKIYIGRDNVQMNYKESQNYHYFAFMNFFQMPALYNGMKYWDSLLLSANKIGNRQLAYDMYEKAAQVSSKVLDEVIAILKPNVVIFTSDSAKYAYNKYGKYHSAEFVINSTHPGCSWWNRPMRKFGGLTGKQELERQLLALKNK